MKIPPALSALALLATAAAAEPATSKPMLSSAERLQRFHQRIADYQSSKDTSPLLICAFGDSVTQGWMENEKLDPANVYHALVAGDLRAAHPHLIVNTLNAGIGGQTMAGSLDRLERDVIRHQPDLVLIGFGLNDSSMGLEGVEAFKRDLRAGVERIARETQAAVVLLTPNQMCYEESDRIPGAWHHVFEALRERQVSGVLAAYDNAIREVGAETGALVADVYAEWERRRTAGKNTDAMLANGLNHPTREGHRLAADQISRVIAPPAP